MQNQAAHNDISPISQGPQSTLEEAALIPLDDAMLQQVSGGVEIVVDGPQTGW